MFSDSVELQPIAVSVRIASNSSNTHLDLEKNGVTTMRDVRE